MNRYVCLKNFAFAVALCCAFASSSAFAYGKKHAKSYVTSGLIAQWDGIANNGWSAESGDIHADSPSTWKELASGVTTTKYGSRLSWGDTYVKLTGNSTTASSKKDGSYFYVTSFPAVFNALKAKRLTVEIFARPDAFIEASGWFEIGSTESTQDRGLTFDMRSRTVDGASCQQVFGALQLWSGNAWASDGFSINGADNSALMGQNVHAAIVVDDDGAHLYVDGALIHTSPYGGTTPTNKRVQIGRYGASGGSNSRIKATYYAIRVYDRVLTAEERAQNNLIDRERFLGEGATIDLSANATDGVTEVAVNDGAWGAAASAIDLPCNTTASPSTVTLHARNTSAPAGAVFEWTGVPSGATYSDAQKSSVTFAVPASSLTVSCRTSAAAFTATATDGETEFSLDGENWSASLDVSRVYGTPNVTLRARNANFAGAYFDWTGLPSGATFDDDLHSSVSFVPPTSAFAVTCGARRASFTATAGDAQTEFSFDGVNWSSSLSLVDVFALSNITVSVRNTAGTGWAHFTWTGLPTGAVLADSVNSSAAFAIPLEGVAVTCGSVSTHATNTWLGGSGSLEDPAMWSLGVVPAVNHDLVIPNAATSGETDIITNSTAFTVRSLVVGGSGEGAVTLFVGHKNRNVVSGDAAIHSGGVITHQLGGSANIKTTVNYKVDIGVGGDMTIDAGGGIDVTGKGHITGNGPEGNKSSNASGSSHGGADFQFGTQYAYDSALEPCMYGSALYSSGTLKGGGVVRLDVAGALVVNGTIAADGTSNASGYGGAAGGAIWITSGTISGAGSITANGGSTTGSDSGCAGCGGRIAIYQNDPAGTDFSAFTGLVAAYGGGCQDTHSYNKQRQPSSAGTVYYQAYGETVTTATLVIDNRHVLEHSRKNHYYAITPLDARFGTGKIGNLVVRNGAQPAISNNTVEVYGNITIENQSRLQLYTGLLKLCGEGEQTITGTNIFYNVSCTVPGKTLKFGTGANDNFRVASGSTLTLKGDESANLVLKPAVAGEPWKITLGATAEFDVSHVTVDHSDASGGIGIEAQSSVDGGSNVNWSFPLDSEPGDPLTWNGSVSGVFAVPGNWTDKHGANRLPLETDVIIIPADCPNYPTVIVDTLFNSLRVDQGAALTLSSGSTLMVTNSFTLAGTFTAAGTEKVVFTGPTLDFTGGTVNAGRSIFTIAGEGAQTLNFGGCSFNYLNVRKPGGSAAVLGGLSADTLDILATNSVNLAFAQGVTLAAANVVCRSRFPAGLNGAFVLAGAAQGGTWYVNASRSQYFSGVKVRDCTASGLPARAGGASEDLGNNVNWTFNAATAEWIGGTGDFDTAANWYPAAVPGAGTDVLVAGFDGASAATASGAVSVRTLVVGGGRSASSLRVNGVLAVAGDVEVNTNGTLVLNSSAVPNSIGRDFIVRRGGKATHTALPSSVDTLAQGATANRFYVEVARDVEVEAGGAVNANACGYATGKGPASSGKTFTYDSNDDGTEDASWANSGDTACAGHGSARGSGNSALYKKGLCYGSMFEPTTHGSGGRSFAGGGAVRMVVGRNMHVAGSVTADGGGGDGNSTSVSATGAGGSVWLDVDGTFSGNGSITARGGGAWDYAGGGGRVALYLRNNEFTGSISAESRIVSHSILPGGGTVLVKGKDSEYYDLKVDCDSWNRTAWNTSYSYFVQDYKTALMATDLLTPQDAARKSLLAKVRVTVGHTSVLNLTDNLKVHDLNMLVNTGCLVRLNYCTLKVLSSTHKDGKGWIGATIERSTRNRGDIRWASGFSVTVR